MTLKSLRRTVQAAFAAAAIVVGLFVAGGTVRATPGDQHQVWVCKYVGQPGDFETLKSGKNPIIVDVAAADAYVGADFADGQTHSLVIDLATDENTGQGETYTGEATCPSVQPSVEPSTEPSPSSAPSSTPTIAPSTDPTPTVTPEVSPSVTPSETPVATPSSPSTPTPASTPERPAVTPPSTDTSAPQTATSTGDFAVLFVFGLLIGFAASLTYLMAGGRTRPRR